MAVPAAQSTRSLELGPPLACCLEEAEEPHAGCPFKGGPDEQLVLLVLMGIVVVRGWTHPGALGR